MLLILAHNFTGTKPDGTSDYNVEVRINDKCISRVTVRDHVRDAGAAPLLRLIADAMEENGNNFTGYKS
jgi:hypothetical protein